MASQPFDTLYDQTSWCQASIHRNRGRSRPGRHFGGDFKALVEEISEYKKEREKKLISLNEEKRKKERDDAEKRKNDRENLKRKAKGLPPLEKGKPKPAGEKDDDVLLTESEFVLSDFIVASKKFNNTKIGQNDKKVD